MSAHTDLVQALMSTDQLRQLYVTSATFKNGVNQIAEVASEAVIGLMIVAETRDRVTAQAVAAAQVTPTRKTF